MRTSRGRRRLSDVRTFWLFGGLGVLAVVCSAAACGGTMAGDCSGGTGDGAGNCIPYDHGPRVAQQAAFMHFGDRAEQVVCVNKGEFRYQRARYHEYECFPIRNGDWQRADGDRYCVIVHGGSAIPEQQVSDILAVRTLQQQRCTEH